MVLAGRPFAIGAQQEGAGQVRNVLGAVAQRRQAHGRDVEAEEQVLAEQALLDQAAQVAIAWRR